MRTNRLPPIVRLGLGALLGWIVAQQLAILSALQRIDVQQSLTQTIRPLQPGLQFKEQREIAGCTITHTVEDGVERIVYKPHQPRFQTPLLMQHGMFHGAWCWHLWQELFAGWGWESHAFSLPGHAGSPVRRRIAHCTLDYYLRFLKAEVERLPRRPVLVGHSMGGALIQWYLKYVGDDLPAAVLVAPWVSHHMFEEGAGRFLRLDPLFYALMLLSGTANPMVRTPQRAARLFISERAVYSPPELHARLGPESMRVLYQHNWPFWRPPERVRTPLLWVAGEQDAGISEAAERRSAAHYRADYIVAEQAGHNLIMEHNYRQTAERIQQWLEERDLR
ncbi:MAG: alpha/beta fold hydrolase [Chloroflexia bacterium]|nr:alpha/beta fold hydrolase [Chloroflexia bacterium]